MTGVDGAAEAGVAVISPSFHRSGVTATFVSMRYVPDAETGRRVLDDVVKQWALGRRPSGILSLCGYLDTDGHTVLTIAQCTDPAAYRPFARSLNGVAAAEPVEYRPYRSVLLGRAPVASGCAVIATFDVDGPDRQRHIIDSIADSLESKPTGSHPGMLSANFHASADGTRVLNYAEWTTDEAHIAFLESATRATTFRITTEAPGVRPIGFKRFHRQTTDQRRIKN
jgi:hypothetical protein